MTDTVNITENLGNATEVAFIFDTTGSMQPCIANVRKHIEKTCEELFENIPNLKIGFIAHGDYCDGPKCYTILPLTNKKEEVFNFVRTAPNTSGGDAPECYELALNLAKTLGWSDSPGGKVVVMMGDAEPHEPDYVENKDRINWRTELEELKAMGVNVYPLQCLYYPGNTTANAFWSAIGEAFGTPLLKLQDFAETSTVLTGFVSASAGESAFAAYEGKLRCGALASAPLDTSNIETMNSVLRDEAKKYGK